MVHPIHPQGGGIPHRVSAGYDHISKEEADLCATQCNHQNQALKQGIVTSAQQAGDYASLIAPTLVAHALALTLMSYFQVFRILSFLNWKVSSYAIPAAVAIGADRLSNQLQPVTNMIGTVANVAIRNGTACAQIAWRSENDRYIGPSAFEILRAVNG